MPNETMYDSTNVSAIPLSATLVLVYIDGDYQTAVQARSRLPNAELVRTTTTASGSLLAQIYDCERGDGNAQQAADWARRKLALHLRPTIYCSRIGSPGEGWPDVQKALTAIGISLNAVDFGIADYTGRPHLVIGSAFTQYANPATSGGDYDLSLTNGIWPNEPEPNMLNKPAAQIVATPTGKGYYIVAEDGGVFAFGDAMFHDSLPQLGIIPSQPVVSMALHEPTPGTVDGYWLLGADGGVFALPPGKIPFYGAANK